MALALALSALLTSPAQSAVRTWSGTSSANWSVGGAGGNWTNAAAPVAADSLIFAGIVNPATVNNLAADTSLAGLSFTNSVSGQNFSLSGARITLGGNISNTLVASGNTVDTIGLDVILSGNRSVTTSLRHNLTVTGVISEDAESRSLIKGGAGTLTLQGANLFTGTLQINEGTLTLSGVNGSILGTSGVVIAGTTLSVANTNASNSGNRLNDDGAVTMNGGLFNFSNNAGAVNYSESAGVLSINAGSNTITTSQAAASQSAVLTFGSLDRNAGATVNFGGTGLGVDGRNQVLLTSAPDLFNGIIGAWATVGNADWASYDVVNGVVALAPASYTADSWASGNNTSVSASSAPSTGSETHTLRFNLPAENTVTLDGINTISGGVLVTAGVGTHISGLSGGSLQGPAGGELVIQQFNASGLTIGSIIQDNTSATSLVKTGNGMVTLTARNTYTGGTVINGGNIIVANAGLGECIQGGIALGGNGRIILGKSDQISDASVIVFASGANSARIQLTNVAGVGYNETIGGVNDAAGAFTGNRIVESANDNFSNSSATLTINTAAEQSYTFGGFVRNASGATDSALAIVKDGPGTQTFSGAAGNVSYTGGTTINAGVLKVSGASSFLGTTAVTLNGGSIEFAGTGTFTRATALGGGSGGVIKSGVGILTLSGANTYAGATQITGGTLIAGIADGVGTGALGNAGDITFGGGTLQYSAASAASDYASRIKNSVGVIRLDTSEQTVTLAGSIDSSNTGGLVKSGTGTLILSGSNTYTGTTIASNGTVRLSGVGGSIADSGTVTVNSDTAILEVAEDETIAALNLAVAATVSGYGILTVNNSITPNIGIDKVNAISVRLAGTAQLKKTGQGTTILSATNSYSGGTWLNGSNSKLTLSGSGTLGSTSGALLIDTLGAVLDLGSTSQTVGAVTLTAGTIQNGSLTGTSYDVAEGTISAALGGVGAGLIKTSAGTATLSGTNTYTGDTTVSEGVLAITGNAIANANKLIVDGGIVDLSGAETVSALFFGDVQQAAGTYSADGAGGTIASANFTGAGTLIVTSGPLLGGFESWITTPAFGLGLASQGAAADPDNDGVANLLEYALNGNPSVSESSIMPDLVVTATDFEFTYSRLDLSLADTVQSFEYGSTLSGWTPVTIPAGSGVTTVGIATVTVSDGGGTDTVKVSIPRSAFAAGKLFGRLQVVK